MKKKKTLLKEADSTVEETPEEKSEKNTSTDAEQTKSEEKNPPSEQKQLLNKFTGLLKAEGFVKVNRKPIWIYQYKIKNRWFKQDSFIEIKISTPVINEDIERI